ncbi:hypothetical protein Tco_0987439 [Tanacetum coccineum]
MEHYLAHTDYPIWEVIQNGNGPVSITTDTKGQIKVLPPRTAEEILARERERKARTTLLMALPEDHLAKFHKMTDEKEIWDAIKSRFGGIDESKKMQKFQSLLSQLEIHGAGVSTEDENQKFLRSLPSAWSQVSLIMRTKPGVDSLSLGLTNQAMNLPTLTSIFLAIPIRHWNDLSANLTLILVGLRVLRDSFAYREYGIRFMLAPRSAKALQKKVLLKLHGIRKLPGSPSFGETLFWIIAELSSLRKAAEICLILCLLLMSSLRNFPLLGIPAKTSTRGVEDTEFLTMIKDFDNIAFGKVMTMAVSDHFLHTKLSIGWRFIFMLRKGTNFSEDLVKKSWGKESANESSSKFIPRFYSSFVEFVQPYSEEFMNVFMRIDFGSTIKLVSFEEI